MRILFFVFSIFCFSVVYTQETQAFLSPSEEYSQALDLFRKHRYGAAQNFFSGLATTIGDPQDEMRVNAEYYEAICALKLFQNTAEHQLKTFLANHPDNKWSERVNFQLGNLNYRKKRYETALEYYSKVDVNRLSSKETDEYRFKSAYCFMKGGDDQKAMNLFLRVKGKGSDYYVPANYYYGHLSYKQGRYQVALESFEKVKDEKNFSKIIPYYIVQIYYHQKRYDELLAYGIPLLETAEPEKSGEISRMIGEAYYHRENYEKALPYLEKFVAENGKRTREDNYQLGYCYYKTGNFKEAERYLGSASSGDDRMAQVSQYLLGDCYLKRDEKKYAQNAFYKASKLKWDKKIKEDALFNYAKITYELSYNPYHEAIEAFHEYLETYPTSSRVEEINELLIYVYLTTRNYKAALESLERIDKKDFQLKSAHQYIAYNRAVELMLAGDQQTALETFKKVSTYPIDAELVALSQFWQGELLYQMERYDQSVRAFQSYTRSSAAYSAGKFNLAQFNIGYAYYQMEDVPNAITAFRKYLSANEGNRKLYADAKNRLADCYFVAKDYEKAAQHYQDALIEENKEPDYTLYQMGISLGYDSKLTEKATVFEKFRREQATSPLLENVLFELGDTYFRSEENDKAIETLSYLIEYFPESKNVRKALLQKGLILYKKKSYDESLITLKDVVSTFPNYQDAREAIERIQDIYVELGRIDEYNEWVENLSFINISQSGLDSVNYRAAENVYTNGDCEKSITLFNNYLQKFDPPIFAVNAHFYLAECYFKKEDFTNAMVHYSTVSEAPFNKFSEQALVTAALLNYNDKNYEKALIFYQKLEKLATFKTNRLEAQIGQMRVYYQAKKYDDVIRFATTIIENPATPEEIGREAYINKLRALMKVELHEEALATAQQIVEKYKTEEMAEAMYAIAYIHFLKKDYPGTEEKIFEMVNTKPTYDDWLAKAFVLLGSVYVEIDDFFQAKATLQSVIDNHDGEELTNKAQQKLLEIEELEKKENESVQDTLEVEFDVKENTPQDEPEIISEPDTTILEIDTQEIKVDTIPVDTIVPATETPEKP